MSQWTLYREFHAKVEQQPPWLEYYQLRLGGNSDQVPAMYVVEEKHGWWNDRESRAAATTVTVSPAEGYDDLDTALAFVAEQIAHRVREGFVHLLQIDPFENTEGRSWMHYLLGTDDESIAKAIGIARHPFRKL